MAPAPPSTSTDRGAPTPDERPDVRIRPATDDDLGAIVALCGSALGWVDGEPNEEQFTWKHRRNPFGTSPMWVAETDEGLAAVRAMMRWELAGPDGRVRRAVRAVDTATHRDHRGRGLFRRLTLGAVEALTDEGVDLVFNTPNDQSRPGYLTMGWEVLGRVPVAVAVPSVAALPRLRRARASARRWSTPTSAGVPAGEALADDARVAALVDSAGPPRGLATPRTPGYLRWRYAEGPVTYRAMALGDDVAEGLAVFRLRRRGASTEAAVTELLVPADGAADRRRRLLRAVLRSTRPDHLLVTCAPTDARPRSLPSLVGRWPAVRAPRLGPVLTWRALADPRRPDLSSWDLALGDVELF